MQSTYDDEADALYIRLNDEPVGRTIIIDDDRNVDIGYSGQVVGIEVLGASEGFHLDDIIRRFELEAFSHSLRKIQATKYPRREFA